MHNVSHSNPPAQHGSIPDQGIAWEPLPSLAHLIGRIRAHADESVWSETMPAEFDAIPPSNPFSEPLPGMGFREVTEPDIFKLFFDR